MEHNLAEQVRDIFMGLKREEKSFLGGPPFTSEIERELRNSEGYENKNLSNRRRICLGYCAFNSGGNVIGYQSTTIIACANPTFYERKYLHLNSPLNYVQLKKIFVDQTVRGTDVARELLERSLQLAAELKIDFVTDIMETNRAMVQFLEKSKIKPRLKWTARKGTQMLRFGISF